METNQATGLRLPEVEAARAAHGSNALPQPRGKGFFLRLLENLSDPIIKILLIALAVNMLFLFRGEGWFETAGIALAVFAAALISTLSESSSENAFLRLQQEAARITCRVRREALLKEIPAEELVVGDLCCWKREKASPPTAFWSRASFIATSLPLPARAARSANGRPRRRIPPSGIPQARTCCCAGQALPQERA